MSQGKSRVQLFELFRHDLQNLLKLGDLVIIIDAKKYNILSLYQATGLYSPTRTAIRITSMLGVDALAGLAISSSNTISRLAL